MNRYHYRVFVGPCAVHQLADRLRAHAMPWQNVTIEGTEHVHYSIDALHIQAADTEHTQWFTRANLISLHSQPWPECMRSEAI